MIIQGCRRIVGGEGQGPAVVTNQPINFLAMVDPKMGKITDPKHELHDVPLAGTVLIFPFAVGSSVGAYVIYSMREYGTVPSAIVCSRTDITTASGCAIANIPLVEFPRGTSATEVKRGSMLSVDADSGRITVKI
jgi:predicted aconitase with swiveling domain